MKNHGRLQNISENDWGHLHNVTLELFNNKLGCFSLASLLGSLISYEESEILWKLNFFPKLWISQKS